MHTTTTHHDHDFLPAAGQHWLLPLYDPLVRVLRIDRHHGRLLELADTRPGDRVLDLGCGTGNLSLRAKAVRPGAEVVAIDPDSAALDRARRKALRRGLEVEFVHGSGQRLPFDDGSFQRVLSGFMVHHLPLDLRPAVMREVRRVLAPGGQVHIVDFGGDVRPSDGFAARRQLRSEQLAGNLGSAIPSLLWDLGFSNVGETDHRMTWYGRITFCRGDVAD